MSIVRKVGDASNSNVNKNNLTNIFEDNFIIWLKKDQSIYIRLLHNYNDIFKINVHKTYINICHNDIIVNYYTEKTEIIFDECEYCYKSSSYESYWTICQIVNSDGKLIDKEYKIWLIQPYKFTDIIRPFHENQIKKNDKYDIKSYIFKLYRSQKGNYGLIPYYKPNKDIIISKLSDELILDKILDKYI
jgi:hypothetical protein